MVLQFLSDQRAFLLWYEDWKKRLPEMELTTFQFRKEENLTEMLRDSTSIDRIRNRGHLALTIFSPNGRRAVNPMASSEVIKKNDYYDLVRDDSNELRLYDFTTNTSSRILFIGNYGPWIEGIAWLTDNLVVTVGEHFDLSGKTDMMAPAIMLFDFNKMTMRTMVGEFIPALNYFKTRRLGGELLTEPRLMFQFYAK
ncbi:MAG: hypothetical protein ACREOO_11690 [bacterium]